MLVTESEDKYTKSPVCGRGDSETWRWLLAIRPGVVVKVESLVPLFDGTFRGGYGEDAEWIPDKKPRKIDLFYYEFSKETEIETKKCVGLVLVLNINPVLCL